MVIFSFWFNCIIFGSPMENEIQIARIEAFLDQVIVKELGKLQQVGLSYMQFVIMGQAVEVLGGLMDNKPMKARGQSAKRFRTGINRLFGGKYRLLNDNDFLYDKLRNQMTHTFIPGKDLVLINTVAEAGSQRHLDMKDGQLVLIGELFYQDICGACERLTGLMKDGRLKPKNIAYEYEE